MAVAVEEVPEMETVRMFLSIQYSNGAEQIFEGRVLENRNSDNNQINGDNHSNGTTDGTTVGNGINGTTTTNCTTDDTADTNHGITGTDTNNGITAVHTISDDGSSVEVISDDDDDDAVEVIPDDDAVEVIPDADAVEDDGNAEPPPNVSVPDTSFPIVCAPTPCNGPAQKRRRWEIDHGLLWDAHENFAAQ